MVKVIPQIGAAEKAFTETTGGTKADKATKVNNERDNTKILFLTGRTFGVKLVLKL
ncbi:MAG: hypothetical protein OK439_07600 [Thaumarchaeota archaeon]|nr:hypothetical protein [Nitrososphaerota archaeon]